MIDLGLDSELVSAYLHHSAEIHIPGQQLARLMDEVLARGLPFRFRAGGGSMAPFIQDGDVLSIAPLAGRTPGVGEVVAFRRLDPWRPDCASLVVHRVIQVTGQGCILLGDNQLPGQHDGPLAAGQLLGAVSTIERRGRAVRWGLGPERWAIALGLRLGLLRPALRFASHLRRRLRKISAPGIRARRQA